MADNDEIMHSLGKIEGTQESILNLLQDHKDNHKTLEHRVDGLEKSKSWLLGAASAVSIVIGYIVNTIFEKT